MHSPVPCVAVDEREGVNDARRPVASARRAAVDVREAVDWPSPCIAGVPLVAVDARGAVGGVRRHIVGAAPRIVIDGPIHCRRRA